MYIYIYIYIYIYMCVYNQLKTIRYYINELAYIIYSHTYDFIKLY